jgi:hypothetical protein
MPADVALMPVETVSELQGTIDEALIVATVAVVVQYCAPEAPPSP